jgi:hypothetical protein
LGSRENAHATVNNHTLLLAAIRVTNIIDSVTNNNNRLQSRNRHCPQIRDRGRNNSRSLKIQTAPLLIRENTPLEKFRRQDNIVKLTKRICTQVEACFLSLRSAEADAVLGLAVTFLVDAVLVRRVKLAIRIAVRDTVQDVARDQEQDAQFNRMVIL